MIKQTRERGNLWKQDKHGVEKNGLNRKNIKIK